MNARTASPAGHKLRPACARSLATLATLNSLATDSKRASLLASNFREFNFLSFLPLAAARLPSHPCDRWPLPLRRAAIRTRQGCARRPVTTSTEIIIMAVVVAAAAVSCSLQTPQQHKRTANWTWPRRRQRQRFVTHGTLVSAPGIVVAIHYCCARARCLYRPNSRPRAQEKWR